MYSVFARPKVTGTGLLLGGYKMAKKMMVIQKEVLRKKNKKKKINKFGKWGNITFIASRDKYRTFTDMKW